MDLKEEHVIGNKIYDHWYYIAKGKAMRKFLDGVRIPEVLDVGAGSGTFSRQLLDEGFCDSAVCLDPNYAEERTENHNGKQIRFVKHFEKSSQKLILMMDVLEHVADDVTLLKKYSDSVEPGGHIFITVPAFQFIWSGHDVFLEHHRRYTIPMIEEVVKRADPTLIPVKTRYFFACLFPAVAAIRLCKKVLLDRGALKMQSELKLYPDWLNKALIVAHDVECRTVFSFNKFCGLTVFCMCRKN